MLRVAAVAGPAVLIAIFPYINTTKEMICR